MSLGSKLAKRTHWALPAAALACVLLLQISGSSWVAWIQHRAFDAFQQLKPREYADAGVRVIDLDDESLARLGQWPWPRTQVARLERRLQDLGASVTAYDIFFSEPDRTSPKRIAASWPSTPEFAALRDRVAKLPDHDALLAGALSEGKAVLGFALTGERNAVAVPEKAAITYMARTPDDRPLIRDYPGAVSNLPQLERAAAGLGNVGFEPELDQVIRGTPLIFKLRGKVVPALSLEALRVAQGLRDFAIKLAGAGTEYSGGRGKDRDVVALKVGRFAIPTDENGSIWLYYTKAAPGRTIPAWRIFEKGFDRAAIEGSICFIGTSATGLKDIRATPLNPAAPGVEVHANVAEQIITQTFLKRPDWALGAEFVYLLAFGLLLLWVLGRAGAMWSAPVAAAAIALSIGMSWHAFSAWRWLLDPLIPSLGLFTVYATWSAVGFVRTEGDKKRITDTFGRYLSPKVVENLAKNPGAVQLGGETREMTFHFCDIRGFTTISEKFDPHGLTVFINNFLTPMTQIILEHDGTIDKYMGDCIMAFWNAPMSVPDHARRACSAALKMHASLALLNAQWQAEAKAKGISLPKIEIGTGLNTGPAVVGNMGSTLRVDYTVLGDDVNLASRLEGQSKTYGVHIVIGPLTREQTPDFAAIELDLIKVKGKTKPVNIYALLGDPAAAKSAPFLALAAKHAEFLKVYRSARFDEAAKILAEARILGEPWHLGKLYDLYAERLAAFRVSAPDPDWDGVFTATSK
ncbi:MAG: adenylate/guanylate cyclase domain-containing protein [Elusimicrobia bacterium]|nr:adenylate/guanylate cyclase domain-containing protein [Elusimicrobiota bacterium]